MSLKALITQGSIHAAFIAISSRIVGSAFRFAETLNPDLQQSRVISNPKAVFTRESITLGLAWGFSLLTNLAIKPLAQKRQWSGFRVQFATALIGTVIAESVGRMVAYRKVKKDNKTSKDTAPAEIIQPPAPRAAQPKQQPYPAAPQPHPAGYQPPQPYTRPLQPQLPASGLPATMWH